MANTPNHGNKATCLTLFVILAYLKIIPSHTTTISNGNKTLCGTYTYCYHINLNPFIGTTTSESVAITSTLNGISSIHQIYAKIIGNNCINPTIDLIFEEIDFASSSEYFDVFDENGDLITKCSGTSDTNCEQWVTCLSQQSLSTSQIKENDTYIITIQGTNELNQLCSAYHDYSLNVILTISCSNTQRILCGTNTWCYYLNLYPIYGTATEKISITSSEYDVDTHHQIYISTVGADCFNPTIDIIYEEIDFDSADEYFDIYDNDDKMITRCNGTQQNGCGVWGQCVNNLLLPKSRISINETYRITIDGSKELHPVCTTTNDYSLNVEMTISCNTPDPTLNPTTANPSMHPTTSNPTWNPTKATRILCGTNTWCYYVDLYPTTNLTSESVFIISETDSITTYHEIYIKSNGYSCINPAIDILYNEIDFDSYSEYFDVYDNDGNLISRCDGTQQSGCGVWNSCLNDEYLSVSQINVNDTYKIIIEGSDELNTLCDAYHTYSLNVELTITCGKTTASPTTFEPINNPTSPTINPTAPTKTPTLPTIDPTTSEPTTTIPTKSPTSPTTAHPTPDVACNVSMDIVNNWPISKLNGWHICYDEPYSDTTYTSSFSSCATGNGYYVFVGAKSSSSSQTIYIGAYGPSSVIVTTTSSLTTAYKPSWFQGHNNVYWYYYPTKSFGFAPNSTIYLNSADVFLRYNTDHNDRLSWHLSGSNGGWRAGNVTGLNSDSVWRKIIYYKYCVRNTPTIPPITRIPTTSHPSIPPTEHPTLPTTNPTTNPTGPPTPAPTQNPTTPTTNPTPHPTVFDGNKVLCGTNTWCYYANLHPISGTASKTVAITSEIDSATTYHKVSFKSVGADCVNPTINVLYEEIDFDSSSEYFDVYENNDTLISRCHGTQQDGCGVWAECINQSLSISKINMNETILITIIGSDELHSLCNTVPDYSLNVQLTISCDGSTQSPTSPIPSTNPTNPAPSIPSLAPSRFPTQAGLCAYYEGVLTHAYDIDYYSFNLSNTTSIIIDSCGSDYDTWLYFQYANGTNVANCDDCGDCGLQTILEIADIPPGEYRIGIGGYQSNYGSYTIGVSCNSASNLAPRNGTTYAPTATVATPTTTSPTNAAPSVFNSINATTFDLTTTIPPSNSETPVPTTTASTTAVTTTLQTLQSPMPTTATTENIERKFFVITFEGDFDAVHQYNNNQIYPFVTWVKTAIDVLIKANEYPILRSIETIVFSIKRGSIVLDFGIETDNADLLDLATRNANETAVNDGFVQLDGNFTFSIIDLEIYTLDPILNGLRIYCYSDYECQDSIILCPAVGCDIICGGAYSCSGANIIYSGSQEDGGAVKIECSNNYACYNLHISANNVNSIEIHCTTQHNDYTCYYTTLHADYANSVELYGVNDNGYGFYFSELYCNNASTVSLFARGTFGFYQSTLYAENAESVSIDCISGQNDIACYLSNYYLPSTNPYNSALLNCYGKGCYFMGTIFVKDTANDLAMSVNSCGECDDAGDCLGLISFRCDEDYSVYESWHGSHETNCDSCGCNEFINSIAFKNDAAHYECYEGGNDDDNLDGFTATTNTSMGMTLWWSYLLAFLAGMFLCCCGGCGYYFICFKKKVGDNEDESPIIKRDIELEAMDYTVTKVEEKEECKDDILEDGVEFTVPLKQEEDDGNDQDETGKVAIKAAEKDDDVHEKQMVELALGDDDDTDALFKE